MKIPCKFLGGILIAATLTGLWAGSCENGDKRTMPVDLPVEIPLYGNSYIDPHQPGLTQNGEGITGWTDPSTVISVYFKVEKTGDLDFALYGKTPGGSSKIKATINGHEMVRDADKSVNDTIVLGRVRIKEPGYQKLDLQGISRQGADYGTYTHLCIGGPAAEGNVVFVPGYTENWAYWGMRGPSVHITYTLPAEEVTYFYNEVTVPEGNDVVGSYYMSNGFGEGYMGMQVNSGTERRILFSVWSPYETDDPNDIPQEDRVTLLARGENVTVKDFGNEGSGGQSYLVYMWEAGNTYRFLTKVVPTGDGSTDYTGYFCGDDGGWRLIASFRRPKITTHYTGAHSFLENFIPSMGDTEREVYFSNQWARTTAGRWVELTEGKFSCDNTGRQGYRVDYDGGLKEGRYYLRNCGFFNETGNPGSIFTRPAGGQAPDIDTENLP